MSEPRPSAIQCRPRSSFWLAIGLCGAMPLITPVVYAAASAAGYDSAVVISMVAASLGALAVMLWWSNLWVVLYGSIALFAGGSVLGVALVLLTMEDPVDAVGVVFLPILVAGITWVVGMLGVGLHFLFRPVHRVEFRRRPRGRCESCGYDLAGLPLLAPCPECGGRTHPAPGNERV